MVKIKKMKNLVIKEKKLNLYLRRLIKKYQISQPRMKKILMLYILVEYLHLATYQSPLIHLLLLLILMMKKTMKVLLNFVIIKELEIISDFCLFINRLSGFSNC